MRNRAMAIKRASHRSFPNLHAAARSLQGKPHEPFGTPNVRASSESVVRRIESEAGMTLAQIEQWANANRKERPAGRVRVRTGSNSSGGPAV